MSSVDFLNPVSLREIRQLVRSRLVATGLVGLLLLSLVTVTIVLISQKAELEAGNSPEASGLGAGAFTSIYFITAGLLLYALPLYIAVRLALERNSNNLDLQYITMLTPRQFADGKVFGNLVLIFILSFTTLPFMVFAYLLRGLDVIQVVFANLFLLMIAVLCVYEALLLACLTSSRVSQVLVLLGMLSLQAIIVGVTFGFGIATVFYSPIQFRTWQEATAPLLFIGAWMTLILLMRSLLIALMMPKMANRTLSFRRWFTFLAFLWSGVAAIFVWQNASLEALFIWMVLVIISSLLLNALNIAMPFEHSRRVRGTISPQRWKRALQFLFFPGAQAGMLWALCLGLLALGGTYLFLFLCGERYGDWDYDTLTHITAIFCTVNAYLWTIRALWFFWLHRWLAYKWNWLVALIALTLGSLLPYVAALGMPDITMAWSFGNVLFLTDLDETVLLRVTKSSSIWFVLAFCANIPEFVRALRNFKPLSPPVFVPPMDE